MIETIECLSGGIRFALLQPPTGRPRMEISAPFVVDAVRDEDAWFGRVRVDGHVLFLCAESASPSEAVEEARASLAEHLKMLFTGATDVEHQQQTERYGSLVEVEAAQVLRKASGWSLVVVRVQDDHMVAVFQRDWPAPPPAPELSA